MTQSRAGDRELFQADDQRPQGSRGTDAVLRDSLKRNRWLDVVLALALGVAAAIAPIKFQPQIPLDERSSNTFFDADVPSVLLNMTDRWSEQTFNKRHPLFSILAIPPVYAVAILTRLPRVAAAKAILIVGSSAWGIILYFLLLRYTSDRAAAVLFTLVGSASASAMFWLAIPERYLFSSLSILLALLVLKQHGDEAERSREMVASTIASLSMTLTNSMLAGIAALRLLPFKRAVRVLFDGFGIVALIAVAGTLWVPKAEFIGMNRHDGTYINLPSFTRVKEVGRVFLFDSMVMPEPLTIENSFFTHPVLSVQRAGFSRQSTTGAAGLILWAALLAIGVLGLRNSQNEVIRTVIPGFLAGQFLLHWIYGIETFLYCADWIPALVLLAAMGVKTRARPVVLLLAAALAVTAVSNNWNRLDQAVRYSQGLEVASPLPSPAQ
jgi:hypothetical protein